MGTTQGRCPSSLTPSPPASDFLRTTGMLERYFEGGGDPKRKEGKCGRINQGESRESGCLCVAPCSFL